MTIYLTLLFFNFLQIGEGRGGITEFILWQARRSVLTHWQGSGCHWCMCIHAWRRNSKRAHSLAWLRAPPVHVYTHAWCCGGATASMLTHWQGSWRHNFTNLFQLLWQTLLYMEALLDKEFIKCSSVMLNSLGSKNYFNVDESGH